MRWQNCVPLESSMDSRYRVSGLLHESPQARLYSALDRHTGGAVILKCFEDEAGPACRRETTAALSLTHRHIVRCLDTFQPEQGAGCIVYEFIAGRNLEQYLEGHSRLPGSLVWRCLRELAGALAYMHERGRIHCDLKPGNVFLSPLAGDGDFRFVLGDLGSVCTTREAKAGTHPAGTPAYIAPERVHDRFSANSDLYSLGVMGFELATGQRPFCGTTEEVLRAHLSHPPPLQEVKDAELRELLEHLLEKEPERRIQSADILLSMLERPKAIRFALAGPEAVGVCEPVSRLSLQSLRLDGEPQGSYRLQPRPTPGRPAALIGCRPGVEPALVMDYGAHGEILALANDAPLRVFGKIGRVHASSCDSLSYASSNRVFRFDWHSGAVDCVFEHCRGLVHHVFSGDHLFWQSRFGMHYVHLARNQSYSFRSGCYLSPSQAAMFADGSLCHSAGLANQRLVFRSPEAEILYVHGLDGPVLGLGSDGENWLAVAANLARPGKIQIAGGSLAGRDLKKMDVALQAVDWCCMAGRLFWITQDGGLFGIDSSLEPVRIADRLPEATTFLLSPDCHWLALQNRKRTPGQISLWKLSS